MAERVSLVLEAYRHTALMCAAFLVFFGVIALLARYFRWRRLEFEIAPQPLFWVCIVPGFLLAAVCLTLIDQPRWPLSAETLDWMFMFSAFLGIPVVMPLFAGAVWASAFRLLRTPVRASSLALVMLGTFALGCAASNIHDVVWCGAITGGFARHHAAGYDLDYFVAFGNLFGIPREVTADYVTLGPCAFVMVVGELAVAGACFSRLAKMSQQLARPKDLDLYP